MDALEILALPPQQMRTAWCALSMAERDAMSPRDKNLITKALENQVNPSLVTPDTFNATLVRSAKGDIKAIEHNAMQLLAQNKKLVGLRFDDFLHRPRINGRDWSDHDDRASLIELQARYHITFTLAHVRTATMALAYSRHHDSLVDFVNSLPPWDGISRIESALCSAWGALDGELTRASSRNFFIALIARALQPGCQVDTLFALEGKQGTLKSKSLRTLFGDFHAEITAHVGTSDFYREMRGIWCAELSELDSLRGRDASTIKRVLSAPSDRYVEKYEKHPAVYRRRAVIVATTNEAEYWKDPTGARRLVPVRIGEIKLDLIMGDRLQWFAEARHELDSGASWWEFPEIDINAAQSARREVDAWEDLLRDAMRKGRPEGYGRVVWPSGWIATAEIQREWLHLDAAQLGVASGRRLSDVMHSLAYRAVKRNGVRGWEPDISGSPDTST